MWEKYLKKVPQYRVVKSKDKIKEIFYEGAEFFGKQTEVFAYLGVPESNKKVPAVVLVHGGLGTAFYEWVKIWNKKGYAAVSMDLCGCVPVKEGEKWKRHPKGGPEGWDSCFSQIDWEIQNQWPFHAVANIILAKNLIGSFSQVDKERIGITGISWGGYLVCIVCGVDSSFRFGIPVYGCGFLMETKFNRNLNLLDKEKREKWLKLWDPANYLDKVKIPMLWITGTNDFAYSLEAFQKSYMLTKGENVISVKVRLAHSHQDGWSQREIYFFADSICKNSTSLAKIKKYGKKGKIAYVEFDSATEIKCVEFNYTKDKGHWVEREWKTIEIKPVIDRKVEVEIPAGTKFMFFNLIDSRDLVVSCPVIKNEI